MTRSISELLISAEFMMRPPFFRFMPFSLRPLSERLKLLTFFGKAGFPKKYMIVKIRGGANRLYYCDTSPFIWFPQPDADFQSFLSSRKARERKVLGRFTWMWASEGTTLFALDDMEFHIRPDEANALKAAIFEGSPSDV